MKELIAATQNPGKLQELLALLSTLGISVQSAKDAGVTEDVVEDADTFEGNALKKARFVAKVTGKPALADDSGIEIDALDGRPGVLTARWAGEDGSDENLIRHTLAQLEGVPEGERTATFVTVAALVLPNGEEHTFRGEVKGRIPLEPIGVNRPKLPYDLIFAPEGHDRTFAQMSDEEKNAMSHRARALEKFVQHITQHNVT
jgi:non-canonical purine NTP pyrophosphatase (RdgB/HAM1 family)